MLHYDTTGYETGQWRGEAEGVAGEGVGQREWGGVGC